MVSNEDIINALNGEAAMLGLSKKSDFPFEVLPPKLQGIVNTMLEVEQYVPEFLVSSMFAAAAGAIGNALQLRVKGTWTVAPSFYFVILAEPGTGKTPALSAAFRPLDDIDSQRKLEFDAAYRKWEQDCAALEKRRSASTMPERGQDHSSRLHP